MASQGEISRLSWSIRVNSVKINIYLVKVEGCSKVNGLGATEG